MNKWIKKIDEQRNDKTGIQSDNIKTSEIPNPN